ncbi:MAG: SDR family NAD(P)-dependent oxidoreductase [Candidatus Marinimicrobia bacterium]|nr:SDR family NAD(P)-dependent oxidoreductase [Candidatus Neomarinimicrobiota bacterium]
MKNLNGKIALVTGASRGIGVHIINSLTEKGINVIGVARNKEGLENTKEIVKSNLGNFEYLQFDLSETSKLYNLTNQLMDKEIDYLINNAGIEIYRSFEDYKLDDIQKIVNVNLLGPMELTRLLIPKIKANKGNIVNIASLAGKKGVIYNGIYSSTKAGLILWSDALDQELKEFEVGVTAICPGYIADTGMFKDGGYAPPALLGESAPQLVGKAVIDAITKGKKEIIVNSGPIRPLLAIGQIFPRVSDVIIKWFGVPELCRKRAFESKGGNRT